MGFYADNRGEFVNIKMDELIVRLGATVRYGSAYSPWVNVINQKNYASSDITIKKLTEEKKVALTDSLVKASSFTHNTNINKIRYTPRQLATGKSCNLPGIMMGYDVLESISETEAVKGVMERILKTRLNSEKQG